MSTRFFFRYNTNMDTYYASPERHSGSELQSEISGISNNELINSLLYSVGGLLAVLNEQRQILSVNTTLLKKLGIRNIKEILGLRPGEMLHCIHSHDTPAGCGTGPHCASCGAAIAIVTGLDSGKPAERNCCIQTESGRDLFFNVRACPLLFHGHKLLLLFIHDRTEEQNNAAVSRVFFHDLNNSLTALLGMSELMEQESPEKTHDLAEGVHRISKRVYNEIRIQQFLTDGIPENYRLDVEPVHLSEIFSDFEQIARNHPRTSAKKLLTPDKIEQLTLFTDRTLLMRVLLNLLLNAFEAEPAGGSVSLGYTASEDQVEFTVRNAAVIPPYLQGRIFQRNFSTKNETGRGLGTWSAKLFAGKFLKGGLTFTSTPAEGTVFTLSIPFQI